MKYLVTGISADLSADFAHKLKLQGFALQKEEGAVSHAWAIDTDKGTYSTNPRITKSNMEVIKYAEFIEMLPTLDLPFKIKNIKTGFYIVVALGACSAVIAIMGAWFNNWPLFACFAFASLVVPMNVLLFYIVGRQFDVVLRGAKTLFG